MRWLSRYLKINSEEINEQANDNQTTLIEATSKASGQAYKAFVIKNKENKMENNKTDKFTFYQPYWDLVKDEDGETVKSIIGHICRYMLDGNEEKSTDQTQALIWEDLVEVLAPQREKELQGKTPKAYNARWKHFPFRRNYYNKMLSLEDDQAKEYLQAICELAFNGRQPKELSATVKKYYELSLLTIDN